MKRAEELKKRIFGVRLHSSFQDFPPSIFSFGDYEVVDWNIKRIVSAIETVTKIAGY